MQRYDFFFDWKVDRLEDWGYKPNEGRPSGAPRWVEG